MPMIAPTSQGQVVFHLSRPSLAWMLIKIGLLNTITFGFYRFWGKTRVRRQFWSALSIAGEPLEYTGRPAELFLGFLIAIAVLAPISGFANMAPKLFADDERMLALAQLAPSLALMLLWPVALFRARRYRLSRTLWRGIHAGQDGSALLYAAKTVGWWLLTFLSLGLAYPWMRVALQRYKVSNTRFGQNHFEFAATGGALFPAWLAAWAPVFVAVVAVLLSFAVANAPADFIANGGIAEPDEGVSSLLAPGLRLLGFVAVVIGGLFYLRYRMAEVKLFTAGMRLLGITFQASPEFSALLKISLIAVIVPIAITLAFILVAGGLAYLVSNNSIGTPGIGSFSIWHWLVVGFVIASLLGAPLIRYILFDVPLYRHLAATLSISDLSVLDTIVQDEKARPTYGEGLADALDVGGL
ncbi:MAG: DUF898 family protein [Alphaproteobacteria bacterium]|nr:DUF898 family protein [Alphaproteobacteria bacterium]